MFASSKDRSPLSRLVRLAVATLMLVVAALSLAFPDNVREYRLYLTEDRPSLVLSYEDISQDWTEAQIKERFGQLRFRCYDNRPGEHPDDRSCFAGIGAHNGSPAMSVAFYLANGKVNHVGITVPWWAHGRQTAQLVSAYGTPFAAQALPIAGVRLSGWKIPRGHAIFFNRDHSLNPLMWNLVLWSSERACLESGCFAGRALPDMGGSGVLRDSREAMNFGPTPTPTQAPCTERDSRCSAMRSAAIWPRQSERGDNGALGRWADAAPLSLSASAGAGFWCNRAINPNFGVIPSPGGWTDDT